MEKVWKAQQESQEEDRKIVALKKQLEEEQKIYDLKKLAQETTGKASTERLEWMYTIKKGPSADEYLLGKPITAAEEDKEIEQLAKKPGALWMKGNANSALDQQAKIRDDPLLAIKQQEQQSLKKILNNPVQMKKIKESEDVQKMLKRMKKKEKKEKKKDKKEKKNKKEKKEHRDEEGPRDAGNRVAAAEPMKNTANIDIPSTTRETRKRSRSVSPSDKTTFHSRSPKRRQSPSRSSSHRDSDRRRRSHSRSRSRSPRRSAHHYRRNSRSRSRSPPKRYSSGSNYSREERTNSNSSGRRDRRPTISEEERKRRLEEMMDDAKQHEQKKWDRVAKVEEKDKEAESDQKHASFIDSMNRKIYTQSKEQLEDRVKRNIHSIQRNRGTALVHEEGGLV
jgi:hypothetical protein